MTPDIYRMLIKHYDVRALSYNPGLQYPHTPHMYNRGSSMLVNSLHSGENNMEPTNSVPISFIQTLKLIVFFFHEEYDGVNGKTFWWLMKKKIDCELVEWPRIRRDLYQHRWMGGPDATPDLWKQPFSVVRASGGYPGNGQTKIYCIEMVLLQSAGNEWCT